MSPTLGWLIRRLARIHLAECSVRLHRARSVIRTTELDYERLISTSRPTATSDNLTIISITCLTAPEFG